ncbi:hypothetical protein ACFVWZ_12410 [Streptomyces sp. NPDC058200]|uniref:hypothetical protein n=1 Tax=Streptomyces sp. NPDC058200 TaxID=3346378 RepID=UPI0036E04B78
MRSKLFGEFQYPTAPLGAQWDHDELSRGLVKLRPPRARMTVVRAVLVDQAQAWRDKYTWRVIAEVPLGKHQSGGDAADVSTPGGGHG